MFKDQGIIKRWLPTFVFVLSFLFIPFSQLHGFRSLPGNLVDGSLNNYFLENIFQFIIGKSTSLWDLGFFWPYTNVIAFSDNLFGSSIIYLVGRVITGQPDTSFQIWFYFGYFVNFIAAYYALKRLKLSTYAATIGAFVFTFSMPVSAQIQHAQLIYRPGIPLAMAFAIDGFRNRKIAYLIDSLWWTIFQFYCAIYTGFFTLLLICAVAFVYLMMEVFGVDRKEDLTIMKLLSKWIRAKPIKRKKILLSLILALIAMELLFYPYILASITYRFERSYVEILTMLPHIKSYLLADPSWIWNTSRYKIFTPIEMRHEHQLFIGLIPTILILFGLAPFTKQKRTKEFLLMFGAMVLVMVLTLVVSGHSLWRVFASMPLFSAIRAVTRIILALLFPFGYFAGAGFDRIVSRFGVNNIKVLPIVVVLLIVEAGTVFVVSTPKEERRENISAIEMLIPKDLPQDAVLFIAQEVDDPLETEVTASWIALERGIKTMNGYSGWFPPGASYSYGSDCDELPKRLNGYMRSNVKNPTEKVYKEYFSRIVPIGFSDCEQIWNNAYQGN